MDKEFFIRKIYHICWESLKNMKIKIFVLEVLLKIARLHVITINVLLFKKLRSGQFKGSKKSWPPQSVPRNGS